MRMMSPNTLMYSPLQTIPQEGCSSIGSTSTHNNDNNANNTTTTAATHRIPNHTAAWRIGHTESSSPQSHSSAADVNSAAASSNNVPSTASASASASDSVDNDVINDSENIIDLSLLSNIGLGGVQCSNNNTSSSNNNNNKNAQQHQNKKINSKSLFHEKLLNQPSTCVEAVLSASCEAIGFDIAEVWLRTGPKTHQLINSHLRPAALENSIRQDLVDVYYGDGSSERTHRLSPALCKRAKEAKDVVWVTSHSHNTGHTHTQSNHSNQSNQSSFHDADLDALRTSISDVRTAVAVPVCHDMSNTNITFIYFSLKRTVMHKSTVEFLVHMSLSAAVASVNSFIEDIFPAPQQENSSIKNNNDLRSFNHSYHKMPNAGDYRRIHHIRQNKISVTGANLTLRWNDLRNVEYLTDGGNSWIHTAVVNGKPVVVKTLKPECQDVALAINEIEAELDIHSKLNHPNIVSLIGAGSTSKGVRFVVLERLDGGTLTQMLGYDTRIRDRRRRFWKRRQLSYHDSLIHARNIADSMAYLHGNALPGSMCLHRDIKPDNIGFTLDGTVKLLDFGLARVVDDASPYSNDKYEMSGETGSLRYMSPEVADCRPYNHKADVYSFSIVFWELLTRKRPYDGMSKEAFFDRVVLRGERPPLPKKLPLELSTLFENCWSHDIDTRPNFSEIVQILDKLIVTKDGKQKLKRRTPRSGIASLIDRHSTWF
eukprot:CAMPEP_0178959226 /NCGR_PEP_ID=MMETSP0789-20121207/12150_1 /TAXON_ID=3005 /ORGANISM="Rhizosolenia setigera, Strain CCMP 1694" /LENGTH=710 /DNA_ID=CAMNT_0020642159 /DNA_START=246 /DNA_END=2378 /DNA_ORIENTATION=-